MERSKAEDYLRRAIRQYKCRVYNKRHVERLRNLLPLVDEANAICKATGKHVIFNLELVPQHKEPIRQSPVALTSNPHEIAVNVRCHFEYGHSILWSEDEFLQNLFLLRDRYNTAMEFSQEEVERLPDPIPTTGLMSDTPGQVLGTAQFYLAPALYSIEDRYRLPVYDNMGRFCGLLEVFLSMGSRSRFADGNTPFEPGPPSPPLNIDDPLSISLYIKQAAGLTCTTDQMCNMCKIEYEFDGSLYESEWSEQWCIGTPPLTDQKLNPDQRKYFDPHFDIRYEQHHRVASLTESQIEFFKTGAITFKVLGKLDDEGIERQQPNSPSKRRSLQFSKISQGKTKPKTRDPSRRTSFVRQAVNAKDGADLMQTVREKITAEDKQRSDGNILLVCADVEELNPRKNVYSSCPLKKVPNERRKTIFRWDLTKDVKQFVFTIVQCDENDFLLESFASVKITGIRRATDEGFDIESGKDEHELLIVTQSCSVHDKVLKSCAQWPVEINRHPLLSQPTENNERILIDMEWKLYLAKHTQPIVLHYTLAGKIYGKVRKVPKDIWSGEDRLHQISAYYKVAVCANPAVIERLVRKWEQHRKDRRHALRIDQIEQYLKVKETLEECGEKIPPIEHTMALKFPTSDVEVKSDSGKAVDVNVELAPESAGERTGYLFKRGKVNKAYKRRWCILRRPYMYYYLQEGAKQEQGVINLIGSSVEPVKEPDVPFEFKIETEGRVWLFQGNSEEDMYSWCRALDPFIKL